MNFSWTRGWARRVCPHWAGKIDEILSAKSTQRQEIFEEAGISHCRLEETQLAHPGEPAADWGQTGGIRPAPEPG